MDNYEQFYAAVEKAAARFHSWDKDKKIRLISHLDADGITASAIIISVLNRENRKYGITILQQLDKEIIKKLAKEDYSYIIFTDFGSGQLKDVHEYLKDKEIIILDHHEPEPVELNDNITHINPHLFGIDGSKEISGSGVVYTFARTINKKYEDLAHLAVIGAIGDVQEEAGFLRLNQEILETALKQNKIDIRTGLRLFGIQTRPIHKILEYSTDPFIPGISGSESGTIQFLDQLGIDPKEGNRWKKLVDLTDDEMKRLIAGIIMKRVGEEHPDDVLGNIYSLKEEKTGTPTKDAREFATLLNACGRMGNPSAGIGLCLGIQKDKQKAMQTLANYKKQIVGAMQWYGENKDKIIKKDKYMIINAGKEIPSTIIGTLASIISKSNDMQDNTYIMSLARTDNGTTKVSLRISGMKKDVDLREIVKKIIDKIGAGEAGGHMQAAGAQIPKEKEEDFIRLADEILAKETQNI